MASPSDHCDSKADSGVRQKRRSAGGSHELRPRRRRRTVYEHDDGYAWLKYGEKALPAAGVVREYFRCKNWKPSAQGGTRCPAKKAINRPLQKTEGGGRPQETSHESQLPHANTRDSPSHKAHDGVSATHSTEQSQVHNHPPSHCSAAGEEGAEGAEGAEMAGGPTSGGKDSTKWGHGEDTPPPLLESACAALQDGTCDYDRVSEMFNLLLCGRNDVALQHSIQDMLDELGRDRGPESQRSGATGGAAVSTVAGECTQKRAAMHLLSIDHAKEGAMAVDYSFVLERATELTSLHPSNNVTGRSPDPSASATQSGFSVADTDKKSFTSVSIYETPQPSAQFSLTARTLCFDATAGPDTESSKRMGIQPQINYHACSAKGPLKSGCTTGIPQHIAPTKSEVQCARVRAVVQDGVQSVQGTCDKETPDNVIRTAKDAVSNPLSVAHIGSMSTDDLQELIARLDGTIEILARSSC